MDDESMRSVALVTLLPPEIETFFRLSGVSAALEEIGRLARARALMPIGVLREIRLSALMEIESKGESLLTLIKQDGSAKALTALTKVAGQYGWNDARQAVYELRARAVQVVEEHAQVLEDALHDQEFSDRGTVAYAVRQAGIVSDVINRQRVGWPLRAIFQ